jgi:hypothetical protein
VREGAHHVCTAPDLLVQPLQQIVMVFVLGVFQDARLALWIMLRLWPVLLALAGLGVAVAILRLGEGAVGETLASLLTTVGLVLSS